MLTRNVAIDAVDGRIRPWEDGTLQEVFIRAPENVQLEQDSNGNWFLCVRLTDGRRIEVFLSTKRARISSSIEIVR